MGPLIPVNACMTKYSCISMVCSADYKICWINSASFVHIDRREIAVKSLVPVRTVSIRHLGTPALSMQISMRIYVPAAAKPKINYHVAGR